jgi:kexin
MKKYVCILCSVVLITLCFYSQGRSDSIIKSFDPEFHQHPIYWYERDVKKVAWMSMDEVAVFPVKGKGSALNNSLLRQRFHPGAIVTEQNNFVVFLKTKEAVGKNFIISKLTGIRSLQHVNQASPVFYTSKKKNPEARIVLTGEIIVRFPKECTENQIVTIENEYGLERLKSFDFSQNTFLYRAGDSLNSLEVANRLYESGRVNYAYPNWHRRRTKKAIPNDPLFSNQWHLDNTGQSGGTAGEDVNITSVWDTNRGSSDEVIAIVDDGLEIAHEDLSPNIIDGESWDYVDSNVDPSPEQVDENHGTACAGVAAASGFNGIGVTGAAPDAGLIGHRLLGAATDVNEADALTRNNNLIDIYSNSWGPADGGQVLEGPGPLTETALNSGVTSGRGGLGNIYVWAGGNGYDSDNSNYDGYANSRYTIAVAASTNDGDWADYSEKGANILVNAPSGGGSLNITTTDRSGSEGYNDPSNYTSGFSGTSSATPLVAGVIALMIEANPDLTWRDVQHILITSAEKNDPGDIGWATNGAGYNINYHYGFGRIDAQDAVSLSAASTCAHAVLANVNGSSNPDLPIPDFDLQNPGAPGVSDTIIIADDVKIEFVEVYFTAANHTYWGYLEITLLSPEGTESILSEEHLCDNTFTYDNWRFGSVRHFGESSQGDWTITVRDLFEEDLGTLQSWSINIYGTVGTPPTAVAGGDQTVNEGGTVDLDGSNSSDDGSITSYLWTQLNGTSVTLSDSTSDQPTFTAPQVKKSGSLLTFRLTVTDDVCLQSNTTINVQVDDIAGSGGGGGGGCFIDTAAYGSLSGPHVKP